MSRFPALLSPLQLGPATLPNRVVSTAHQTGLVAGHLPTPDLVAYHEERASGGVGAIFLEAVAVHPTGLLTAATLGGYLPEIVGGYRSLSEAVGRHDTRLFVQLFHGGREQIASPPRPPTVAPSSVPSARLKSEPRALTLRELDELVAGFATAAAHARAGGLNGIELSMAHGYLVPQFFSRATNRRTDAYNGSLEARIRLAVEIVAVVREAAGPGLAVGVRLSADEIGPGLLDASRCAELAGALCASVSLDFVSFALGHSSGYASSTYIVPPPPASHDLESSLDVARTSVAPVPVIATTRVVDLEHAERLVASGATDAVGMTRALIADPHLVRKAVDDRTDETIECIGCNQACIGHYHAGVPIGCVVNPRTGRERSLPQPARAQHAPDVLVVGAGPAGIAAALEAARHGSKVTLLERSETIGGQLRLAGRAPAHAELWERYHRLAKRQLAHEGVAVMLGVDADEETVSRSDLAVIATGAVPYDPGLPIAAGMATIQAWAAIEAPDDLAGPILVADWGGEWAGLDAAEVLAAVGHAVTLACAASVVGEACHQYQRALYLSRFDDLGVQIQHHRELVAEDGELRLRHVYSGRTESLPDVATIVLAQGRAPYDPLWHAVEGRTGYERAGDVLGARTAEEAVLEGTLAARGLLAR